MNSRFLIFLLLMMSSVAHSQNKEFSYTYLELNATQSENIGYVATISVGLPASIYLKGSVKNEDIKSKETLFQKTGQLVAIGYHSSIADIFKSVSKSGFSFNFARIMDVYAEIGANTWELENLANGTKGSTDTYVQAGIRMGDAEGWEYNLYLESSRFAVIEINSSTDEVEYALSDEVNNDIGIRIINNFSNRMSVNFSLNNNNFSGASAAFGLRFRL